MHDQNISLTGGTNVIFAYGANETFAHHVAQGSKLVYFGNNAPAPPSSDSVQLDSNYRVEWQYYVDKGVIDFTLTYNGIGW